MAIIYYETLHFHSLAATLNNKHFRIWHIMDYRLLHTVVISLPIVNLHISFIASELRELAN